MEVKDFLIKKQNGDLWKTGGSFGRFIFLYAGSAQAGNVTGPASFTRLQMKFRFQFTEMFHEGDFKNCLSWR